RVLEGLPLRQALLRLRSREAGRPLAALLRGDVATLIPHPLHAGVPVLPGEVEGGEVGAGVLGLELVEVGLQLVVRGRSGGDAGVRPERLVVEDGASTREGRHSVELAVDGGRVLQTA